MRQRAFFGALDADLLKAANYLDDLCASYGLFDLSWQLELGTQGGVEGEQRQVCQAACAGERIPQQGAVLAAP